MDSQEYNSIVSFIWGIADDCLRDVYVRGKYRDVILPMTVIRRLDAMLEDTKQDVLSMKKQLDAAKIDNQWPALCNTAGQAFCNASPFLLKDLTSRGKKTDARSRFQGIPGRLLSERSGDPRQVQIPRPDQDDGRCGYPWRGHR